MKYQRRKKKKLSLFGKKQKSKDYLAPIAKDYNPPTTLLPFWGRHLAIGGKRAYHLKSLEDKMLLAFISYRTYLNYDYLGLVFGFDGSNVGRLIKKLEPVLAKKFKLPKRPSKKRISFLARAQRKEPPALLRPL